MGQTNPVTVPSNICFTPVEAHGLAEMKIQGEKDHADLADCHAAYHSCVENAHPSIQWFQEPTVIVGGFALSIGLGMLIYGIAHK
jgi:hypothetical protein